jgi:phage-related holin
MVYLFSQSWRLLQVLFKAINDANEAFTERITSVTYEITGEFTSWLGPVYSLLQDGVWKVVLSAMTVIWSYLFFVSIAEWWLLGFLLCLDFITGAYAAYRKGIPLTSAGARRTMTKVIQYFTFLFCVSAAAATYPELEWLRKLCFIFIVLTEIWSIGENLDNSVLKQLMESFRSVVSRKGDKKTT